MHAAPDEKSLNAEGQNFLRFYEEHSYFRIIEKVKDVSSETIKQRIKDALKKNSADDITTLYLTSAYGRLTDPSVEQSVRKGKGNKQRDGDNNTLNHYLTRLDKLDKAFAPATSKTDQEVLNFLNNYQDDLVLLAYAIEKAQEKGRSATLKHDLAKLFSLSYFKSEDKDKVSQAIAFYQDRIPLAGITSLRIYDSLSQGQQFSIFMSVINIFHKDNPNVANNISAFEQWYQSSAGKSIPEKMKPFFEDIKKPIETYKQEQSLEQKQSAAGSVGEEKENPSGSHYLKDLASEDKSKVSSAITHFQDAIPASGIASLKYHTSLSNIGKNYISMSLARLLDQSSDSHDQDLTTLGQWIDESVVNEENSFEIKDFFESARSAINLVRLRSANRQHVSSAIASYRDRQIELSLSNIKDLQCYNSLSEEDKNFILDNVSKLIDLSYKNGGGSLRYFDQLVNSFESQEMKPLADHMQQLINHAREKLEQKNPEPHGGQIEENNDKGPVSTPVSSISEAESEQKGLERKGNENPTADPITNQDEKSYDDGEKTYKESELYDNLISKNIEDVKGAAEILSSYKKSNDLIPLNIFKKLKLYKTLPNYHKNLIKEFLEQSLTQANEQQKQELLKAQKNNDQVTPLLVSIGLLTKPSLKVDEIPGQKKLYEQDIKQKQKEDKDKDKITKIENLKDRLKEIDGIIGTNGKVDINGMYERMRGKSWLKSIFPVRRSARTEQIKTIENCINNFFDKKNDYSSLMKEVFKVMLEIRHDEIKSPHKLGESALLKICEQLTEKFKKADLDVNQSFKDSYDEFFKKKVLNLPYCID